MFTKEIAPLARYIYFYPLLFLVKSLFMYLGIFVIENKQGLKPGYKKKLNLFKTSQPGFTKSLKKKMF